MVEVIFDEKIAFVNVIVRIKWNYTYNTFVYIKSFKWTSEVLLIDILDLNLSKVPTRPNFLPDTLKIKAFLLLLYVHMHIK